MARARRSFFGWSINDLSTHARQTKRFIENERRIFYDQRIRQRNFIYHIRRRGFSC